MQILGVLILYQGSIQVVFIVTFVETITTIIAIIFVIVTITVRNIIESLRDIGTPDRPFRPLPQEECLLA